MRSAADERPWSSRPCGDANFVLRHADHLRARVHILHEAGDAARFLDRERFGRVVRRAEEQSREQSTDGDAFAGPQPERRPPTVVTPIEHRVGMDADRPIQTPRLPLQHENAVMSFVRLATG